MDKTSYNGHMSTQEVNRLQTYLDTRTKAENEAIALISECRFQEAMELLSALD